MNYILSIIFVLFGLNAWTQDFELFKIQSSYYPNQAVKESSLEGEVGFWEWSGQFAIPQLIKSKKTVLIHKLGYTNLRVDTEGIFANAPTEASKNYHTISYSLGAVKILNPKWRLLINISPTLASDFSESLNSDDLLFQGSVLAMKAKNQKLTYGFGLAYTTRFGRQIVIPTGMLRYNTQKMDLDVLLPNKLSIMFKTHQRIDIGLAANLDGGIFNNSSEIQVVNTLIDEAAYSRINIGPTIVFKLKNAINIFLAGGVAGGRRLEFIDPAKEIVNRTPEIGPFFKVGLSVNPKGRLVEALSKN